MAKTDFKNIDEYHLNFSEYHALRMQKIKAIIHDVVPGVEELISYQIPCFKHHGYLIYYASFANHISLSNPFSPELLEHFKEELLPYKMSKSVIQLPMKDALPELLIREIVLFRKKENEEKSKSKTK